MGGMYGYAHPFVVTKDDLDLSAGNGTSVWSVVAHNLWVGLQMFCVGLLSLSVGGLLLIGVNGVVVGKLFHVLEQEKMLTSFITGILPHGFIEVIGFSFFVSASAVPLLAIISYFVTKIQRKSVKTYFYMSVILLFLGCACICIAGFLEVYVSFV
ncbi:MAG: stage II sporulation protein M [Actinomycetaceae bacterium]|nr:stage II sporulation protein M [Actinomycetaceae bacterium]